MNKIINIWGLFLIGSAAFCLDVDTKKAVDQFLADAENAPKMADVQVVQINKMGDDAMIYALPKLIMLNSLAIDSGSEFYTLMLLTKSSNMTTKISQNLADRLIGIGDPNDERHAACIKRIQINLRE